MKLTAFFSFLIIVICIFSSCQKTIPDYVNGVGGDGTSTSNSSLVKTYSEDVYSVSAPDQHSRDSFGLTYDNKGRLLSLTQLDSANGYKFIYQYNNNNTITLDQYDNGSLQTHENVYLTSFSFSDSTYQYNNTGDTLTEKYIYDAGKRLVQLNSYDYSTTNGSALTEIDTYTYDNFNDVVREFDVNLGSPNDTTEITSTYPNHIANNLNLGLNYMSQPKYLPETVTATLAGETQSATHVYTFDNKNRLITDQVTSDDGIVGIKRYYY